MEPQHSATTLAIVQAMADELTDYLMEDELYRQLFVKTPQGVKQPKMTIGALLEQLETLSWQRESLTGEQQAALAEVQERVDLARAAFGDKWRALLRRELKASMDSWKWYLEDAARDPEAREHYGSEARIRTRIDLIMRALAGQGELAGERQELGQLDERLRKMMRGSGYVGPGGEQAHYPQDAAWWLYGQPKSDD
jgi:hypothetical protein